MIVGVAWWPCVVCRATPFNDRGRLVEASVCRGNREPREVNHYQQSFLTDNSGTLVVKRLSFGLYRLGVMPSNYAPTSQSIEIRSAAPTTELVRLGLIPLATTIEVRANLILIVSVRSTRSARRRLPIEPQHSRDGRCRTRSTHNQGGFMKATQSSIHEVLSTRLNSWWMAFR